MTHLLTAIRHEILARHGVAPADADRIVKAIRGCRFKSGPALPAQLTDVEIVLLWKAFCEDGSGRFHVDPYEDDVFLFLDLLERRMDSALGRRASLTKAA